METKKESPELKPAKIKNVEIKTNTTETYGDLFILVNMDGKVKIAVTNKIISNKEFKSFEEAKKYINSKPWELIVNVSCVVYDLTKEIQKF